MLRLAAFASFGIAATALLAAAPQATIQSDSRPSPQATPPKLLVFSKTAGFRHESIPDGIACLRELSKDGDRTVFAVDATEDAAVFTPENLAKYRGVVFLSTTGDVLDDKQQEALQQWVTEGGGYVGIHAAADTEQTWPWYGETLVGAWFKTHPSIQKATVKVEDRGHPSTSMLPERWERTDEWYVYDRNPREKVRVLASLDESTYNAAEAIAMGDHPIAWCHEVGKGRSWYTGGGHTKESYAEPLFRAHMLGGVRWALKIDGGDAPNEPAVTPVAPSKPVKPKVANPDGDPLSHPAPR